MEAGNFKTWVLTVVTERKTGKAKIFMFFRFGIEKTLSNYFQEESFLTLLIVFGYLVSLVLHNFLKDLNEKSLKLNLASEIAHVLFNSWGFNREIYIEIVDML